MKTGSTSKTYSSGPGGKLHLFKRTSVEETQPGIFHVRKGEKPFLTLRGNDIERTPHETLVKQAIKEGKIKSHPDYPELGKVAPKEIKAKIVIAARKARKTRFKQAAGQKNLVPWIASSGGIQPKILSGEIRDIIWTMDAKGKKKLLKGLPPGFMAGKGRGLDVIVRDAREAGFDVRDENHLLDLIEKDLGNLATPESRVVRLADIEEQLDILEKNHYKEMEALENETDQRTDIEEVEADLTTSLRGEIASKIAKEEEFDDTPTNQLEDEYSELTKEVKPTQDTLIKGEPKFELKGEEAPPKRLGPQGKKATFPTEKIKTEVTGEQVSLLPKREGEQINLSEIKPPKGVEEKEVKYEPDKLGEEILNDIPKYEKGVSSATGKMAKRPKGIRTLGIGIAKKLEKGRVDLRGQIVNSIGDMAELAQVYRDPRVETLRIIYMKGNKIIAHEGISSRMPNFSAAFGKNVSQDIYKMKDRMKRMGADGYYMLHNHPSGDPEPSKPDINLTAMYNNRVPGFKGHVVIDSGKYAWLGPADGKGFATLEREKVLYLPKDWKDPLFSPAIPHKALGSSIRTPDELAIVGNAIKTSKDYLTFIYRAGRTVRAIQEMPISIIKTSEKGVSDYIRGRMREFGAADVFVYIPKEVQVNLELSNYLNYLIENGTLLDVVYHTPLPREFGKTFIQSKMMDFGKKRPEDVITGIPEKEIPFKRVAQPKDKYGKPISKEEAFAEEYIQKALGKVKEKPIKGEEIKFRETTTKLHEEFLTPIEGNPLDQGAVAFLKSEKFADYINEMPAIGELSPKEVIKYDPELKRNVASFKTKAGELKPAIRQSGYHVLPEFADAFEGAKDVSKLTPSWTDPTRMIQELDQGKWGGMAQKHILWPARMNTLAKLKWADKRKGELDKIIKNHNITSGKKGSSVGDVIEYVSTEQLKTPSEELLQIPKVKEFLKRYDDKTKIEIINACKEMRTFFNDLLRAQNAARKARKQREIPYRKDYRPWILEENIWNKLLGLKQKPETIMESPEMPDFIFPNQPPNPRSLAREGGLAKYLKQRNITSLMADYIETATKDIFDTNVVHNNKIHSAVLKGQGLENAAEGIDRWTAEVFAGVKPRVTRTATETLPKPIHKGTLKIRRMLTRAVFPLNWTWNMFIQTSSAGITYARYGNKANLSGLRYFTNAKMRNDVRRNAYSYILKSRWGGKAHYQDVQDSIMKNKRLEAKPIEKVEDFANFLTSSFESGLTGHAVAAAHYDGRIRLKLKGRELWEYASEGGAKTQSMYNYGDIPGMLRAKEVGALFPFQTFGFEVFNTVREMNIPVVRKLIGKTGLYETMSADSAVGKALMSNRLKILARWLVAIVITDMVGEKAIGRKPWVITSFVPFIGYLLGGYAGRGPVPHQYIQDAKKGIKDVLVYGNFRKLRKWLIGYHVLAGVQINRMLDGIEAVAKQGRVENVGGKLLYKVSPKEYPKAVFMGPFRTKAGKEYIKKIRKSKSLARQLLSKEAKKSASSYY